MLPPSEGKTAARRGRPMDLDAVSFPSLTETRRRLIDHLAAVSADPEQARAVLDLGPSQAGELAANTGLTTAPATRADRLYTGVLYEALDLPGFAATVKRRAARSLVITSALYGLVRPGDRIAGYRMSGAVSLPGLGPVARQWRSVLGPVVAELAGSGLVVDLRSQTYAAFFRPSGDLGRRTATVRVLLSRNGTLSVVSHVNKATKGRLARALLEAGAAPRTPEQLRSIVSDLGWRTQLDGTRLDVIVDAI